MDSASRREVGRIRTIRCSSRLARGERSLPWGRVSTRWVSAWGDVCQGCICPGGVCPGGCLVRGRCLPIRSVCVCAWGGGVHLSPMNRMTDRCKNITLPLTSFAGGNKALSIIWFEARCTIWCRTMQCHYLCPIFHSVFFLPTLIQLNFDKRFSVPVWGPSGYVPKPGQTALKPSV